MAKVITDFNTSISGVINFPADHPGNGAAYQILTGSLGNGSFKWTDSTQGNRHTVIFCIPWANIGPFRKFVMTATSSSTTGGVTTISRTLPLQSPVVAHFPNTYAIQIEGAGDGTDVNVSDTRLYSDCIVAIEFGTLPFPTEGSQPFIEVSNAGSADYDTVPDSSMAFSNGEKIDHDAGVLVGQLAIQITAHQIPDIASWKNNLMPLKGKINSSTVTIQGYVHPIGTLLFPTFESQTSVDSGGIPTSTGTISLIQRDIPWNSGIRSDGVVDTISPAPYVTANLNGVFTA